MANPRADRSVIFEVPQTLELELTAVEGPADHSKLEQKKTNEKKRAANDQHAAKTQEQRAREMAEAVLGKGYKNIPGRGRGHAYRYNDSKTQRQHRFKYQKTKNGVKLTVTPRNTAAGWAGCGGRNTSIEMLAKGVKKYSEQQGNPAFIEIKSFTSRGLRTKEQDPNSEGYANSLAELQKAVGGPPPELLRPAEFKKKQQELENKQGGDERRDNNSLRA